MSKFKELCLSWIMSMITGFDGNVNNVVNILSRDLFSGSLYAMVVQITNILKPISLTIVSICFLLEFLKITMKMDILKWEYGLACFFKFVFAKVCIDISYKVLEAIYATGASWIAGVGSAGSTLGDTVSALIEAEIAGMGFWAVLGLMLSMAVVFLAIWIIGLIVQVIAYGRMFELLLYIAVSPLPCAFLPMEEGAGSRITKKFFLSFAGICLQGLFIIASIKLYVVICSDTLLNNLSGATTSTDIAYNLLLGALILVMAVVKSSQWAKSILDAV